MSEIMEMEAVNSQELHELRTQARNRQYGHNPVLAIMGTQQKMYNNFREQIAQIKYEHPTSQVLGVKAGSEVIVEYRLFRKPRIIIREGDENIAIS